MENTPTPNADFENYLRKNLRQIDESPDEEVWINISAKQARPNFSLKFRRFIPYVAAAALVVSVAVGLWWRQQKPAIFEGAQSGWEVPAEQGSERVTEMAPEPEVKMQDAVGKPQNHAFVPNFSPRVNSVPAASVQFKAEHGLRYKSPLTGTTVNIPANSLVDQNGRPVSGDAELFFREYRTIEEFLASGMPMHYSDGRGGFYFNSGGMFEVRVSQAGTALKMGPGKDYDIAFTPTQSLEKASLYYLNDQTREWEFRPDAAFDQASLTQPPIVTESTVIANNLSGGQSNCKPVPGQMAIEPDPAELVKLGVQTGFELATGKLKMPKWFLKNPTLTDDQLLFRMERGLVQIKKHRDQDQLFFPEDLNKFFTELSAFKGCYFTYNLDSLGGAKSAKNITNGDYWQRITVAQVNGSNCVITLYDGKEGQLQFHAVLTGSTENKNFNPSEVIANYQRLREQRQQDFARKNQALRYFLYSSIAFQPSNEWCYSINQWLDFFENNHPMMARRYADLIREGLTTDDALAANAWKNWQKTLRDQKFDALEGSNVSIKSKDNLTYALHLSDFGTYNCDQIFRLGGEGVQFVNTAYKTSSGAAIIPAFVSILEKRTKVFFTLPTTSKLLYSPDRKIDVIVTDKNGRQFHLASENYSRQKFNTDGLTVLTLNDVTEQTQSPRAWADLLEI